MTVVTGQKSFIVDSFLQNKVNFFLSVRIQKVFNIGILFKSRNDKWSPSLSLLMNFVIIIHGLIIISNVCLSCSLVHLNMRLGMMLSSFDIEDAVVCRMLLWHGSRLTNWAGILGQGLRIAPPEAPVTGYMVSKLTV